MTACVRFCAYHVYRDANDATHFMPFALVDVSGFRDKRSGICAVDWQLQTACFAVVTSRT